MNKPNLKWRFPLPRCRFNLKDILLFQTYLSALAFWPLMLPAMLFPLEGEPKAIALLVSFFIRLMVVLPLLPLTAIATLLYTLIALWGRSSRPSKKKWVVTAWLLAATILGVLVSVMTAHQFELLAHPFLQFLVSPSAFIHGSIQMGGVFLGLLAPILLPLFGFYRESNLTPLPPSKKTP